MGVQIRPLTPSIGVEVTGIDLREPVDRATLDRLNAALVDHIVLVIRDQRFTPEQYFEAVQLFGEPMRQHYSSHHMPGLPDVGVLSSRDAEIGPDGRPILSGTECWHTDHVNHEFPPKATVLYAVSLPSRGGDTSFANMRAAYAALPEQRKRHLDGMRTLNGFDRNRKVKPEDAAKHPDPVEQPLVRTHPENGTKALYFHPTKTQRIVGMEPQESWDFLDALLEEIIRPEIVYRHHWRVGDMLLCDNRAALHVAHADYNPAEGRKLYRVILKGDRPY